MSEIYYDVVVVGGGAAGLSAGAGTAEAGLKTAIIERNKDLGGILLQCIHDGFGLHHFKEELTGPEYAERVKNTAISSGCHIFTETTVTDIAVQDDGIKFLTLSSRIHGILELKAQAVILAMGCRERNRGNLGIPGERPAGVYTAGFAQRMLNINGCIPGKTAVIIGSGDIGLIMARRLSWSGMDVRGVVEIMPHPSGLPRNIAQCLDDFGIPLYLNHATTGINGKNRVESVEITPLGHGAPDYDATKRISCDTVLFSVGLIPENELSTGAGIILNPETGGPLVDSNLMTNINGIFACGNVLHVHDLVDFVSQEAINVALSAIACLHGKLTVNDDVRVIPGVNVKYTVPNSCQLKGGNHFYLRSIIVADRAEISISQRNKKIYGKKQKNVKPAEMLRFSIPENCEIDSSIPLTISLEAI